MLIVVLATVSCREEVVSKPDNLLSKEKMAAILYDITLINSIKGVNKKKLEDNNMHLDSYLYVKHQTDSLQFASSNNYYAVHPMKYDEIYAMVQARLAKERKTVGEDLKAEQARRDSIQKVNKEERKKKIDTAARAKLLQPVKKR